jgi:formylglycine-generating enzyme required for sulfatase activity
MLDRFPPLDPVWWFALGSTTIHIGFLALAIIATFTAPAHTQGAATGVAKDAARGSKAARLSVEALCAQLTLDEVTAIMGKEFERRPDAEQSFQECKYGDSKDKQRVRYFSLGSSIVNEASWRKMVESGGKGKVTERDGVLVGNHRGNVFGALDDIWFKDKQGHALYLRVNAKITEDQAVALAKAAMN